MVQIHDKENTGYKHSQKKKQADDYMACWIMFRAAQHEDMSANSLVTPTSDLNVALHETIESNRLPA